jgi:hypothetical protein
MRSRCLSPRRWLLAWALFCPAILCASDRAGKAPVRLAIPSAPLLAPSAQPVVQGAALVSIQAAAAPVIEAAAPVVAVQLSESRQGALAQLAPSNAANVSGEQASALAGRLLDPSLRFDGPGAGDPVAAPGSGSGAPALSKAAPGPAGSKAPGVARRNGDGGSPRPAPRPTLGERYHYARLWVQNMWFYVYTNIKQKWGPYHAEWSALGERGITPPVSRPRLFFAHLRVMGQAGSFSVMGFNPLTDALAAAEGRQTFRDYFDAPEIGPRERAAFDAFVDRASRYNAEKRASTNFRKMVRDSMLKASVLPPAEVAPFFDGLYLNPEVGPAFQHGQADAVLHRFQEIILEELKAEPAGAKGRILGVMLIGSFANGGATPKSDFDGELVTEGGSSARVAGFVRRVIARWTSEGRQKANPVTFHMYPFSRSRWVVRKVHYTPYLVISPDAALAAELGMRDDEPLLPEPSRHPSALTSLKRHSHKLAVLLSSFVTE